MAWTTAQDRMLREFYAQYPAHLPIPIKDIAAVLGKSANTVRSRAFVLGLSEPSRPKGPPMPPKPVATCPVCGESFTPYDRGGTLTQSCSRSCAAKKQIATYGHNRGALGLVHTEEARAKMGVASRRMWEAMTPEARAKREETARMMAVNRSRSAEQTHTRSKGGRRADLNNMYFRSAWEATYARWLNYRRDVVRDISAWEYEPVSFTFPVKRGVMSYLPDFRVLFVDGHHEWHEVKGWMTPRGATALKRFAKYYPNEPLVLVDEPVYKSIATTARHLIAEWE